MLEQKGESFVNRFGINHMVVVQDKDEIIRDSGDFIEQGYQNRFGGRCGLASKKWTRLMS
jgi:hypothetical protein